MMNSESRPSPKWVVCAPPAVLLAVAVGFLIMAHDFPPASGQVPIIVGWTMIVLAVLDLLSRLDNPVGHTLTRWVNPAALTDKAERAEKKSEQPLRHRQVIAILGITVFALALVLVGVMGSVPIFALLAIRAGSKAGWLKSALGAAATTLLIWLLFSFLLRLQLFPGVLFGGE